MTSVTKRYAHSTPSQKSLSASSNSFLALWMTKVLTTSSNSFLRFRFGEGDMATLRDLLLARERILGFSTNVMPRGLMPWDETLRGTYGPAGGERPIKPQTKVLSLPGSGGAMAG